MMKQMTERQMADAVAWDEYHREMIPHRNVFESARKPIRAKLDAQLKANKAAAKAAAKAAK